MDVVPGDARLSLQRGSERFGVIVVDAFNSDAIPVHLLTREAFTVYKSRLRDNGFLVFHISNRYVDLEPILANLAAEGRRPMKCLSYKDLGADKKGGHWASHWVVLAEDAGDLDRFGPFWKRLGPNPAYPVWTDDFSNLFQVLRLAPREQD